MELSPPQYIDENNDAEVFRWYAGNDLDKWQKLVGMTLVHQSYGPGELVDLRSDSKMGVIFYLKFNHLPEEDHVKGFIADTLSNGLVSFGDNQPDLKDWKKIKEDVIAHIRVENKKREEEYKKALLVEEVRMMREALERERLEKERLQKEKEIAARYLYSKDPKRYSWAKYYLT